MDAVKESKVRELLTKDLSTDVPRHEASQRDRSKHDHRRSSGGSGSRRESTDSVSYEKHDGAEEVSIGTAWNGVSTAVFV